MVGFGMLRKLVGYENSRVTISITTIAVLFNSIASFFSTETVWIRLVYVAAALLTIIALVHQARTSGPYERNVAPDDWLVASPDGRQFSIAASEHGKGAGANARLLIPEGDGHQEAFADILTSPEGDITVTIGAGLDGLSARIVVH